MNALITGQTLQSSYGSSIHLEIATDQVNNLLK